MTVKQKVYLDGNFTTATNEEYTKMLRSNNTKVRETGTLGLATNYLYSTGQLEELNNIDIIGTGTIYIDDTPFEIRKVGKTYELKSGNRKSTFDSLNSIKKLIGESLE